MAYPNVDFWCALQDGHRVRINDKERYALSVVDCGSLFMPTGQLVACDPFALLQKQGNPFVQVPPGHYRVLVTLADVSDGGDGSHVREAYASLRLDESAAEVTRRIITPLNDGSQCPPEMDEDGAYFGFGVDAGTACFVDNGAVAASMRDSNWYESIFDDGSASSWFARMDDPNHIREGIANIQLPLATRGENIVIVHSGWGDGHYPVVGGYSSSGALVSVHIDFLVVFRD